MHENDFQFEQIEISGFGDSMYYTEALPLHQKAPLWFEENLAQEHGYKKLPTEKSRDVRKIYKQNIPDGFCMNGSQSKLYAFDKTLIATGYTRIVVGDYGAFVEFPMEYANSEIFVVKTGQEFRLLDLEYTKNIKYHWYTLRNLDIKIY